MDNLQLSLLGLQFSVIEMVGAVIGLAYLFFEYRASIWTWVFGVLMPVVYVYLFFRNGLYANMSINVYYIVASVYGFVAWRRVRPDGAQETRIESCPRRYAWPLLAAVVALTAVLTFVLMQLEESQYPLLDGLSASLSIVMMYMLSRRWYQQWILCIVTEPVMIALGLLTGMYATAVMYVVYLVVAVMGFFKWRRSYLAVSGRQSAVSG